MAKLTSFSDFIGGGEEEKSKNYNPQQLQIKPYIYILRYIISKEDYIDELLEYISNYTDDETDYEDENSHDLFMNRLKINAENHNIDEIEEMIFDYEEYIDDDFDEDDDDFEEKMYDNGGFTIVDDRYGFDQYQVDDKMETLSDKLKDFLKMDITFDDIEDDFEDDIDSEKSEYIDYEEIEDEEVDGEIEEDEIDEEIEEENKSALVDQILEFDEDILQDEKNFEDEIDMKLEKKIKPKIKKMKKDK